MCTGLTVLWCIIDRVVLFNCLFVLCVAVRIWWVAVLWYQGWLPYRARMTSPRWARGRRSARATQCTVWYSLSQSVGHRWCHNRPTRRSRAKVRHPPCPCIPCPCIPCRRSPRCRCMRCHRCPREVRHCRWWCPEVSSRAAILRGVTCRRWHQKALVCRWRVAPGLSRTVRHKLWPWSLL